MANGEKKDKTRNEKGEEKQVEKPNAAKETEEGSKPRPPTGALYTPLRYQQLAANSGKIFAYGPGTLRVATSANSLGREADIQNVYYAPEVHARLVSLGKLEGQGWDVRLRDGTIELRDRDWEHVCRYCEGEQCLSGEAQCDSPKAGFAAWTTEGEDPTHEELLERLGKVAVVVTAKGADGMRATLMTWHRRLGHPSFKTMTALAEGGPDGMAMTKKILGFECARCMCYSEISTLLAPGAKSCRSVPGSSPHRHSGANAHGIGWWKGM